MYASQRKLKLQNICFFHGVKIVGHEILCLEMHKPHKYMYQMLCFWQASLVWFCANMKMVTVEVEVLYCTFSKQY